MEPVHKEENPSPKLPKKTNKPIKKQPLVNKKGADAIFFEEESILREDPSLQ